MDGFLRRLREQQTKMTDPFFAAIDDPASVDCAIETRIAVRAFGPQRVTQAALEDIMYVSNRAPSGSNTRPWRVYVLQGAARETLVEKVCAAHDAAARDPAQAARYTEWYDYYPARWESPFLERRRENGLGLYALLGIGKGDKASMHAQQRRNFRFFDAPVGLMFTVDGSLGRAAMLDYGMFLQSIMVAARARGLHTCPQAAWVRYASLVMPHIGAAAHERLVCGMALGYADTAAEVNRMRTPREEPGSFVQWVETHSEKTGDLAGA